MRQYRIVILGSGGIGYLQLQFFHILKLFLINILKVKLPSQFNLFKEFLLKNMIPPLRIFTTNKSKSMEKFVS